MTLSIIIPSFRQAHELDGALKSISNQIFIDYEVIIMDGALDIDTADVVKVFQKLLIRFYQENDNGVYDAMNNGIKYAKGDWVYFMGCDDRLYDDNVLNKISPNFAEKIDMFYGDVVLASNMKRYDGEFDLERLLKEGNICHQSIFYKRTVFDSLGYFNLKYKIWADWEFNTRCFRHTEFVIKYINMVIALYNDVSGISVMPDKVFIEELPFYYLKLINQIEIDKKNLLNSKSFVIGNKLVKIMNIFGIDKLFK